MRALVERGIRRSTNRVPWDGHVLRPGLGGFACVGTALLMHAMPREHAGPSSWLSREPSFCEASGEEGERKGGMRARERERGGTSTGGNGGISGC